jgi:chemotaxis signal transduction protein
MLGGEMFSLSILRIKEIIWYANLTEVPMMPRASAASSTCAVRWCR